MFEIDHHGMSPKEITGRALALISVNTPSLYFMIRLGFSSLKML